MVVDGNPVEAAEGQGVAIEPVKSRQPWSLHRLWNGIKGGLAKAWSFLRHPPREAVAASALGLAIFYAGALAGHFIAVTFYGAAFLAFDALIGAIVAWTAFNASRSLMRTEVPA